MAKKACRQEQIFGAPQQSESGERVAKDLSASTTSAKHVLFVKEKLRRAGAEPTA